MWSARHKQLQKSSLGCLVHTWGNDTLLLNKNKLSHDWTGAPCVYMSYICDLWEVFVLVSQLLAPFTVSVVAERPRRLFCEPGEIASTEKTYLLPPVGLPRGASPRPTGLLCPRPRQMTAVFLLYFGLVLINTGYLPLLGPPTTSHWALQRGGERKSGVETENVGKAGHTVVMIMVANRFLKKL